MIRSCDRSCDPSSTTAPLNMATATSVFHRVRTGSKIGAQYDQEGNLIQVQVANIGFNGVTLGMIALSSA